MIRLISDIKEFKELKEIWNNVEQKSVFSSFIWNFNSWKYLKQKGDRLAVYLYENKKRWLIFPFKYKTFYHKNICLPISSIYLSDYFQPAASSDHISLEEYAYATKEIVSNYLQNSDYISVPNVQTTSKFFQVLNSNIISSNYRIEEIVDIECPRIVLNEFNINSIKKSKLKKILRKNRQLEPYSFKYISSSEAFSNLLPVLLEFNTQWWNYKDSIGLINSNSEKIFMLETLNTLFIKNRILCSVVYKNDAPASIGIAFKDFGTASYYVFGHDIKYEKSSIGNTHWYNILKSLPRTFLTLDFMRGGDEHKYNFSAKPGISKTIRIY